MVRFCLFLAIFAAMFFSVHVSYAGVPASVCPADSNAVAVCDEDDGCDGDEEEEEEEDEDDDDDDDDDDRKFSVSPVATLFANYHIKLDESESANSGFGMDRAYLGVKFEAGEHWSGRVVLDAGSTKLAGSDLDFVMYVKNAYATWSDDCFSVDFGLIKTKNFEFQEKIWGHRYLMKVFADQYGFASSADFGFSLSYEFTDWLSADLSMVNGKGYKKLDMDNNYKYGLGLTLSPVEDHLWFRFYYDLYTSNMPGHHHQHTLSAFAGYRDRYVSAGAEYWHMINSRFVKGASLSGLSAFATVNITEKWNAFVRYDNLLKDYSGAPENSVRGGIEFSPVKYVSFSPNVSCVIPKAGKAVTYLYLNVLVTL